MLSHPVPTDYFAQAVTALGGQRRVVTTRAIFNSQGVKVLDQGVALLPKLYARLVQHQLATPLEESLSAPDGVTPAVLRECALAAMERVPLLGRMASDPDDRALLLDSIARIPLPPAVALQLTVARETQPRLFGELVKTALVAAWLSLDPVRPSRPRALQAATVGLLHDLGLLHLDPVLLEPGRAIGDAQRRQLFSHPLLSQMLAQSQGAYAPEVLQGIGDHHEFLDGSGYPRGLSGDQIGPLARLLALAEMVVYAHGRALSEQRLSVMLRMNMHRYDAELCQRLLGLLRADAAPSTDADSLHRNPVAALMELDDCLQRWPRMAAATEPAPGPEEAALAVQIRRLQLNLAQVGATPTQLALLGEDELDPGLHMELTLLVDEAAWQLRALARQCQHRCNPQAHGNATAMQTWVEQTYQVLERISQDTGTANQPLASQLQEALEPA